MNSGIREPSSTGSEKGIIRVVFIISLVVELDIIPIDQMAYFFVYSGVSSVFISSLISEIRSLRSVGNDVSLFHW
jgi:hypothetical protein